MRPSLIISEVGIGLRRNLTMTVAMLVTMSLSLALVGSGLLINKQVGTMKDFWYDRVEVSVYLCGEASTGGVCGGTAVTEPQRQALLGDLETLPQVEQVFYESQEDAYDRFREQFADSPDLVENVTADALPESFRVKLVDPEQFEVVASSFQGRPGVEQVQDQKALLEPFFNVLDKLRDYALILAGVELIAAVLLVINTIVISANGRRRETGIMRLVGASTFSIQVPFLIEGVLAGFFGALFASGALAALKAFVIDGSLRQTFEFTAFVGWDDVLSVMPLLFLGGVVVAGVTSFVTLLFFTRV